MLETPRIPRVEDVGAGHVRVLEDRRVGVGPEAGHDPGVRAAPGQQDDRRVRLLDRPGRVAQRALAGLVGADLVAGRAVGRRARATIAAGPQSPLWLSVVALPLADLALELLLERRPRCPPGRARRAPSGRRPARTSSLTSEAKTAFGLRDDVDVDALALTGAGVGRRASARASASGLAAGIGRAARRRRAGSGVARRLGRRTPRRSASGSVTRTVLGASGGRAAGPARNRSTRASRWSNRSPAPKALTRDRARADREAEQARPWPRRR